MTMEFMCVVCMYVRPRPRLDEDAEAELSVLTVTNGQMVCMRHAGCACATQHDTIMSGVNLESMGEMRNLDEYQRWREAQDEQRG